MKILLLILAIFLCILLTILYIPLRANALYKNKKLEVFGQIGFIKFRVPLNKKKKQKESAEKEKPIKDKETSFLETFSNILTAFYNSSNRIKNVILFEKLNLKITLDMGDAAATGMSVGFMYAEIYKLIGFLGVIFKVKKPDIEITPKFDDEFSYDIEFDGIIKTKIVHIILAGLKFYKEYNKAKKGKD